jgi:hypothetical protein
MIRARCNSTVRTLSPRIRAMALLCQRRRPGREVSVRRRLVEHAPAMAQRLVDNLDQVLAAERLLDEVEHACLHRAHGDADLAVPGDDDGRRMEAAIAHRLEDLEAAHARHAEVEEHARRGGVGPVGSQKARRVRERDRPESDRAHQQ